MIKKRKYNSDAQASFSCISYVREKLRRLWSHQKFAILLVRTVKRTLKGLPSAKGTASVSAYPVI